MFRVLLAALIVLASFLAAGLLGLTGLARLVLGRTWQFPVVRSAYVRMEGLLRLALTPWPIIAGWWAVSIAEARNNWVDEDGNGMLDPFVNGQYDWADVNLADSLVAWGFLNGAWVVIAAAALFGADRAIRSTVSASEGPLRQARVRTRW